MKKYIVRYKSTITGCTALYDVFFDKNAAHDEAKAFRNRCIDNGQPQLALSISVEESK